MTQLLCGLEMLLSETGRALPGWKCTLLEFECLPGGYCVLSPEASKRGMSSTYEFLSVSISDWMSLDFLAREHRWFRRRWVIQEYELASHNSTQTTQQCKALTEAMIEECPDAHDTLQRAHGRVDSFTHLLEAVEDQDEEKEVGIGHAKVKPALGCSHSRVSCFGFLVPMISWTGLTTPCGLL